MVWREENYKELKVRKDFELKYLKQNYNVILMYLQWMKPYMKHIERLQGDVSKLSSADLVASFEGSMVELEILGQKIPKGNSEYFCCLLLTFQYRVRPSMPFTAETPGYHKGPIHVGETKISWRAYSWTQKQIDNFILMKEKEDLEMLKNIDGSIKATLDAIGEDLETYLKQAEETFLEEKEEEKPKPTQKPSILEPFQAIGGGFKEMFTGFLPKKGDAKKRPPTKAELAKKAEEKKAAEGEAIKDAWRHYKNFKKAHRMITW